jgi:Tfp pilus assembly protein PilF
VPEKKNQTSHLNPTIETVLGLLQSGQLAAAAATIEQVRKQQPDNPIVHQLIAKVYGARNDPVGVLVAVETALTKQPTEQLLFGRIHALYSLGRLDEALAEIDKVNAPSGSILLHNLNGLKVMCLQRHGKIDEISPIVADLIAVEGRTPRIIAFELELLRRQGHYEKAIDESEKVLAINNLNQKDREKIGLGLARMQDHIGEYEKAFATAEVVSNSTPRAFDSDLYIKKADELMSFFDCNTLKNLAYSNSKSSRPIFIIGMPRSGTSMLEQIIASHPQGGGLGERQDPFILAEDLSYQLNQPFPMALTDARSDILDPLADRYLDMIKATGVAGDRIVNKALGLDLMVGFLTVLLPNSRFIWIRRNPADNLLSIFLHPVYKPWAWRLEDLIVVRQAHDSFCSHWLEKVPSRHLDVSYESLTKNQTAETNRVLAFLGLEPNPNTLSFHESTRTVMTPSAEQVRRPMHTEAVDRWTNYKRQLKPVLQAFDALL